MKIVIVCLAFVAFTIAEPPVDNRYLPPQQGFQGGFSAPSQTYGVPRSGFGSQRQTNAVFGARPSSNYGAPSRSRRPDNQYGPPSRTSNQYLPPTRPNQPSNSYQAPNTYRNNQPTNQFQGSNQYQAPSAQYGAPTDFDRAGQGVQYSGTPSQEYGSPGFGGRATNQFSRGDFSASNSLAQQSRQYLPPGRSGDDDGSNGEPANYSFEYMVKDDDSGNDFGHRESRQGNRAEGLYYVLLPDGRKQTVEYEADQDGYRPRISYQDTGIGAGYDRSGAGYQSQYPSGSSGPY